ncbi:molecular chaperone DnaK [Nodosilinea sp. LEGE 07088]|uniref:molecular chaperone DnaK n=1 Tax=Nodosilinea sp. LEGE 07088 TaxID=2777968 RepID=UPI00187F1A59|nr:molecular chaperone DnaK [Nodosilinea sp. LEGE 07088]MBE9140621.1 molecular chaperone DnaK [Nodosilinea sp. LEGE 07088]
MGKVVGIDLGTTNSVVSVMEGGKPVVIANAEGMRTTPSVVAFSKEGERLVGQMARRQTVLNPQNTFYSVKRYMGRRYAELDQSSKRVPYTIRRDENGNVKIRCPRLEKDFAPEELSAIVLRKLADEASRYLGQPVTGAVITVPAYFNDAQRQATRNAGRIAGLEVKRILNEPTAAALAYGLDQAQNETILVFDLGGGTFDVSILDVGDGVFEVRSTSGDTQLGGTNFDTKIVDWLADEFLEQEGIDLRKDRQALQRLTEAAEKAKIELSGVATTEISLPFITATPDGPKHIETRLSRSQFESLCGDLVSALRVPLKQALTDAGLTPNDIDEVVLVGGGSRMPMVQDLVRGLIGLEPSQAVNPDEAVAVGAAVQAGIITQEVQDIMLLDVTSLSLGLETIGGVMKKVIPRNTTIPVRRSDVFSTSENNQTSVEVHVLQGEREMGMDNKSLGRFKLMGIPPAPRGVPQVLVSFDIDANGILQVSAMDKTTGREQSLTVQGASNLEEGEVQRMIREAEEFAETDRLQRERVEKRNRAEALTFQAERLLREVALDFGMQFARDRRRRIEGLVQELRDYLEQSDERGIDIAQAELQDELYDLNREAYLYEADDAPEGGILDQIGNTLKKTFAFDDDLDARPNYGSQGSSSWGSWDDDWDYDNRGGDQRYGTPAYDNRAYGTTGYGGQGGQRYDNGSYGNQGYNNQGYNNQGYNNQGYNNQGYSDRGYGGGDGYGSPGYDRAPGPNRSQPPASDYGQDYGGQDYRQDYGGQDYRQDYGSSRQQRPDSGGYRTGSDQSGYGQQDYGRQDYERQDYERRDYERQDYGLPDSGRSNNRPDYAQTGSGSQGYGSDYNRPAGSDRGQPSYDDRRPGYDDQRYDQPSAPDQGSSPGYRDSRSSSPPRQASGSQDYDSYAREAPPTAKRPSQPPVNPSKDAWDDDPWGTPAPASRPPAGQAPVDRARPAAPPSREEDDNWSDRDE